MKTNILPAILLMTTLLRPFPGLAQQESAPRASNAEVQKAIKEVSGVRGLLNSLGLNKTHIVAGEMNLNYVDEGEDGKGIDGDGPTIVLENQISDRVRAQVKLAFGELIAVERSQIVRNMNWNAFVEEAKIIIDQDPNSRIPFVTIIGKQELETGGFDSELGIEESRPLHKVTRVEGAYAVQFQMDKKLIKALDSVAFSAFVTGQGSEDADGQPIPGRKGAMIVVSKALSDRLILNGSLTRIAHVDATENRLNWGVVYSNEKAGYKVFFNQARFNYNPLYPETKNIWTVGVVKKIGEKNSVTAETTKVGGVKTQFALGYSRRLTSRTELNLAVRKEKCVEGQCVSGTKVEGQLRYSFEKEKE